MNDKRRATKLKTGLAGRKNERKESDGERSMGERERERENVRKR